MGQHLPRLDPGLAAKLAPGVVGGEAVISAPLDVEADQVEAEVLVLLLEQVLGQLGGEGRVQLLGLLGSQATHEGLQRLVVVQLIGGELGLGQGDGLDLAPKQIVAVDSACYQAVPEPEKSTYVIQKFKNMTDLKAAVANTLVMPGLTSWEYLLVKPWAAGVMSFVSMYSSPRMMGSHSV